jgi:hypothetical protein
MHKPKLIDLPWEPIDTLSTVSETDVLVLRKDKAINLELFRYFGPPKYRGIFISEQPTSQHSFDWPEVGWGGFFRSTHFLRVAKGEVLNPLLPWEESPAKADYAMRVVAAREDGAYPKLYNFNKSYCENHRWSPCNGYGKHLCDHWVSKSLRLTK